jgi:hypothetical protein
MPQDAYNKLKIKENKNHRLLWSGKMPIMAADRIGG